jgi:hypothetical protein
MPETTFAQRKHQQRIFLRRQQSDVVIWAYEQANLKQSPVQFSDFHLYNRYDRTHRFTQLKLELWMLDESAFFFFLQEDAEKVVNSS